ncbi:CZB domain-containing protein [Hymenobacter koreensis]|uniref:Chemoreceptor zinc-binding domain-containing protein n=1 Tax=Hymenobacter koreensis TaxID=1084523 RepID=A0ABP8IW22_9BACT
MAPDEIKREFDAARLKHVVFKSKLRSFLYGSRTAETPIRDAHVCSFGQWLEQVGLPRFGYLPNMQHLDRLHTRMHTVAGQLMDLHGTGETDKAIAGLSQINAMATELLSLLDTLEAELRTEGH